MAMHLYDMAASPYCAAIRCALEALGLSFEIIEVKNWDRGPVIIATNGAYYHVPLIVDEGVPVFPDSAAAKDIQYYLNDKYAGGRLLPAQNLTAQEILTQHIENEVEDTIFRIGAPDNDNVDDLVARTMTIRHRERRFGRGCVDQWRRDRPQLRARADMLLEPFERDLQRQPYLFGDAPVYTDFALWGVLYNLTYKDRQQFNDQQQALADFFQRLAAFRY